jgi:hypothetical protein
MPLIREQGLRSPKNQSGSEKARPQRRKHPEKKKKKKGDLTRGRKA